MSALPTLFSQTCQQVLISVATAALRQKKAHENELDRIAGTRLTLETQVCLFLVISNTSLTPGQRDRIREPERGDNGSDEERRGRSQRHPLEAVRISFSSGLLIRVSMGLHAHNSKVEKVDQTMDSIREQMDLTNEISDAISNPVGMGNMIDEVGQSRLSFDRR